jgi:hypothetical protein
MKRVMSSWLVIIGVLVLGLLTWTVPAESQDTPGVWKLAGSMATDRRAGGDARLRDGRILAVGGTNTTGVDGAASIFYNTAEIYDPVTATWSAATDSLETGRALFSVAGLPEWNILFTGGWNGSTALSSAEIYDQDEGVFKPTGSMMRARMEHRSIQLYNGKVLITGGFDSSGNPTATAEIYNPANGTFEYTTRDMAAPRAAHQMNTVGDGKILITGGLGAGGVALSSCELFDPATETFLPAGSLLHARARHRVTVLPTGDVFVTGGNGGSGVLNSTEIYNFDRNAFTSGPTLNQARQTHNAPLLPNGLVLIAGGNNNPSVDWDIQTNFLSSAELYNPATNTFTLTGSKINATSAALPYLLWTGKFMVAGGGTNETELYTPEMPGTPETWVNGGTMAVPRTEALWTGLDDGTVLITGGLDAAGTQLATAELYDYLTGAFTTTAGPMSTPRQQHRMIQLYTGKVLVTGGKVNVTDNYALNSAELYDPAAGTFTPTGNMNRYRRLHRSTELPNGKILITGGLGGDNPTANGLPTAAEIYDPATGVFTQTTHPLSVGRRSHYAFLLRTGKVLIAGGNGTGGALLNSAELYDPDTDTFTATGNMNVARAPFLTMLPDGKVLVSNGSDASGNPLQSYEIYDPGTGTFTLVGNGMVARDGNRVTRLPGGKILLVGGKTTSANTSVTDTAELYSHLINTFTSTDSLLSGRRSFVLANLANGRILVAGGVDGTAPNGTVLSSAELYTPVIADEIDTTITSGPDSVTDSTDATFTFTATAVGSTYKCSLDNAAFATCITPKTYSSLSGGSHRFQVYATDPSGDLVDPTPAIYTWTIIETRITSHPRAKTKETSATFAFDSPAPGSTFECSLDNAAFSGCTSPKVYPKLKVGSHNFKVRANAGGHPDPTPANCDWTIDNKAPNTTITSAPSKLTNDPRATFSFISTEEDSSFECSIDAGTFVPCTSPWTSEVLSDGMHTFLVRAIDGAENADKSAAKAKPWTVDTLAPDTTIIPPKTTASTKVKFKFTATEKKCTFECRLDSEIAEFTPCKSSQSYTGLDVGSHFIQVRARDAAGNVDPTPYRFDWTTPGP